MGSIDRIEAINLRGIHDALHAFHGKDCISRALDNGYMFPLRFQVFKNIAYVCITHCEYFFQRTHCVPDLFGALKNMIGDPKRSLKEVLAMRDADIRDILENLKAQGKHIAIIQGARDAIFPMERMQRVVNTTQVDGFYSVYGAHNEIISNPEAYITVIDHALDALEKLSLKDKNSRE